MDVEQTLASLTVEQKASLLAGADSWHTWAIEEAGVPSVMVADGPLGLRKQRERAESYAGFDNNVPATCFPAPCALACSFDEKLEQQVGAAMGEECRSEGVAAILGPGVNIKRNPLCGRNFEYFSEDPLLAGKMGAALVRGIQSRGVGSCVKHFAANSQEKARLVSDSIVDERALHEIYLRPFEIAVREAQPWLVMTAYNRLNGTYCSQNEELLAQTLRGDWGFEGACVTDWGAMDESVPSVAAGLDLCMPGPRPDHVRAIVRAVQAGELSEEALDAAARRMLEFVDRHEQGQKTECRNDRAEHLQLARRAAAQSAVLLENDGVLPLVSGQRVAVVGAFAKDMRFQGAGSSHINPLELDCPLDALREAGVDVVYTPGYDPQTGETTEVMLSDAARIARSCDIAVVFVGLPASYESEGFDRTSMLMPPGHNRLVERVCRANGNTAVVLMGGAPVEMPWRGKPAAVLLMYLPGCQGGHAVADLLTGRANPSGKLAETWPVSYRDTALGASYPAKGHEVPYVESVYVGYRYYDAMEEEVAYPFGHGLSYTRFEYDNLKVVPFEGAYCASCDVRNVGARAGSEVVQVYVRAENPGYFAPPQQLVAFKKLDIAPGQAVRAVFMLGRDAFAHWDASVHEWTVEQGPYEVRVGTSSRGIRLERTLLLGKGTPFATVPKGQVSAERRRGLECYYAPRLQRFSRKAFAKLYGKELPAPLPKRPYTHNTVVGDLLHMRLCRFAFARAREKMVDELGEQDGMSVMFDAMVRDMPLRATTMGGLPHELVEGMVDLLNRHVLRGLHGILRGLVLMRKRRY